MRPELDLLIPWVVRRACRLEFGSSTDEGGRVGCVDQPPAALSWFDQRPVPGRLLGGYDTNCSAPARGRSSAGVPRLRSSNPSWDHEIRPVLRRPRESPVEPECRQGVKIQMPSTTSSLKCRAWMTGAFHDCPKIPVSQSGTVGRTKYNQLTATSCGDHR